MQVPVFCSIQTATFLHSTELSAFLQTIVTQMPQILFHLMERNLGIFVHFTPLWLTAVCFQYVSMCVVRGGD